jgi:phytanoyl-CoA hydroxylase
MVAITVDRETDGDYPDWLYIEAEPVQSRPSLADVGDKELQSYATEGFLDIERAFDAAQVNDAINGLLALMTSSAHVDLQFEAGISPAADAQTRMDHVRRLMRFVDHEPRVCALAYDPALLAVVRRILGTDDVVLFQDMALLKPPGAGREKPWHQDKAFFPYAEDAKVVGVWIALDPATPENGCMHIIPGSHRQGPVIHFRRRDWQICDTDVETGRAATVPLVPGGALFFDGLMHHGTPANRTKNRRRALQFHYTPTDTIRVSDEYRLELFGSEGKDVTC